MNIRDLQGESEEEEAEGKQAKRERRGGKHWVGRARGYRAGSGVAMLQVSGDGATLPVERPPGRRSVVLLWWAGTGAGRRGRRRGLSRTRNKLHRRRGGRDAGGGDALCLYLPPRRLRGSDPDRNAGRTDQSSRQTVSGFVTNGRAARSSKAETVARS